MPLHPLIEALPRLLPGQLQPGDLTIHLDGPPGTNHVAVSRVITVLSTQVDGRSAQVHAEKVYRNSGHWSGEVGYLGPVRLAPLHYEMGTSYEVSPADVEAAATDYAGRPLMDRWAR